MSSQSPSPAMLAHARVPQKPGLPLTELRRRLLETAPEIQEMASRLGLDLSKELERWVSMTSLPDVTAWVTKDASRDDLLGAWNRMKSVRAGLLAAIVCELRLSHAASWLGPFSTFRLDLVKTMQRSREDVARAASSIPDDDWGQRTSTSRRMALAAAYFEHLAHDAASEGESPRRDRLLRGWARATILSARYALADEVRLNQVRRASSAWSNLDQKELCLLLENLLYLYDVFNDHSALRESVAPKFDTEATSVKLLRAEAWVKLAATASSSVSQGFLDRAMRDLRTAGADRHRLSDAAFAAVEGWEEIAVTYRDRARQGLPLRSLRGLRFPWGFRTPGFTPPAALEDVGDAVLRRLGSGDRANSYLIRDLRADLASSTARMLPPTEAIPYLQQAVEIRAGRAGSHLPLFQSYFRSAEDLYHHAELDATHASSLRRRALIELLSAPKTSAAERAASLVLIAGDVKKNGANPVSGVGGDPAILIAVSNGDDGALMRLAAEIILEESQLDDTKLGGRGEVRAVRGSEYNDEYTFVLKSTAKGQVDHDLSVQELLRPALQALNRDDLLLTDHLCTVPREDPVGKTTTAVWEVRWYEPGDILSDYVRKHPGDQGESKLRLSAEYLGIFHRAMWRQSNPKGTGQQLRRKDVGMWLKTLLGSDWGPVYRSWRQSCEHAPDMRRRDAHPDNWIVTEDGAVVAFDFEASTARPLFYELAQLTEDGQLLAAPDLGARHRLLNAYVRGLGDCPALAEMPREQFLHLYATGGMARCVRIASDSTSSVDGIERAMQTFNALERWLKPELAPVLFIDAIRGWWRRHPGRQLNTFGPLSDGRRTRLSKAISYNLRHNRSILVGRDGWVDIEHLVDALRANGHNVDVATVLAVAQAPQEHRFEVSDSDIRARYGHSRAMALKTTRREARPMGPLFHGTPMSNLHSILDARAGLVRGNREFVHLSETIVGARRPAERYDEPVYVLKVSPDTPGLLPESGEVWLARRVPAPHVTIVPLFEELGVV